MARTHKLSDLHYVLLATAANRASGSLLPPSSSVKAERASITRAVRSLIARGFVEEVETQDPNRIWRQEGDRRFAAVITTAGRTAIHVADGKEPEVEVSAETTANEVQPEQAPADPPAPLEPAGISARAGTKQALLIELLQRTEGRPSPNWPRPRHGCRTPRAPHSPACASAARCSPATRRTA